MARRSVRFLMILVASALALAVVPQTASAQDNADDKTLDEINFERSVDDPINLGDSFVAPDIQPGDGPAAGDTTTVGGTGGGGGLAVTGTDVEPILALSLGLLAAGGSALVTSRRKLRDIAR